MNFIACQQQIRYLMLCCTSLVTVSCATVPNIVDFEPKLGPVGTEVLITGANLAANIQALTPVGDNWTIFGGITSVIHPVNASSSIVITPSLPPGGSTALTQGVLVSDGPMVPSLGGRVVNLRYRPTIGDEIWLRVRTTPAGRFAAQLPTELLGSRYTVKAFHSGARGIGPLRSQEVTVAEESDPGPVVPGGGSVVTY